MVATPMVTARITFSTSCDKRSLARALYRRLTAAPMAKAGKLAITNHKFE
jgi:hypothetical protein